MDAILVIADDDALCRTLCECLSPAGFLAEAVHDGETGLAKALSGEYALVVLALLHSGMQSGLDLLRRLRARVGSSIVMLTPRTETVDRILILELGADDCLSEPFNPREILARIHAILRRAREMRGDTPQQDLTHALVVNDISLDTGRRQVRRTGEAVELTAAEFSLLEVLMNNAGQVVRREELAARVLGRALSREDRSLDTHVSRLRRKLGRESPGAERIMTIRNVGYLYVLPPAHEQAGRE
jgi:two-component system response regulator CpxR